MWRWGVRSARGVSMADAELIRRYGTWLLAIAISADDPDLAQRLTSTAVKYLDEAATLEGKQAVSQQRPQADNRQEKR